MEWFFRILLVLLLFMFSCSTEQAVVQEEEVRIPLEKSPVLTAGRIPEEKTEEVPVGEKSLGESSAGEKVEESPVEEELVGESLVEVQPLEEELVPEKEAFDPRKVSQEEYDTAIHDIKEMIGKLNGIVREKDFNAWMSFLADSSLEKINSREFLEEKANELHKKNLSTAVLRRQDISRIRKINFRGVQDYFEYVVVPSHANDHVDEISFSSQTRVTAYTRDDKGQRLILYDLENMDGSWKIIIVR
jgi:hypothetical protein